MAKILLAWELGAGLGHCVKLAPIAAGLIEHGHNLYFAARDVNTARQVGGDLPITYLPAPELPRRPADYITETYTFAHILHNAGFSDFARLASLVDHWRKLFASVNPDVIVCEHAPGALLASRTSDAARVVMGTGFSLPPNVKPLPDLRPRAGSSLAALTSLEDRMLTCVNRLLSRDGQKPLEQIAQLYADVDERYLLTFRELDHHPIRDGDVYWGTWFAGGGAAPAWPDGNGMKAFAYLKPTAGPWRLEAALKVLSELPLRWIIHVGAAAAKLQSLNCRSMKLCSERVDIAALLADCDVAMLHGTAATTAQLLLAGIPLLLVPLYLEHAAMSLRVRQIGAGIIADRRSPGQIASCIKQLSTDGRYQQAARRFAHAYSSYDPLARQREIVVQIDTLSRRHTSPAV